MDAHYNLHCGRSCSGGDGVVVVLTCSCVSVVLVSYCVEVGGDTVHVTSYLRKSDEFRGNPSRLSVKTCAEISGMYSASLRIVCSESADCL